MKKPTFHWIAVLIGILLLCAGFALLRLVTDPRGILLSLPYICIGLGCGAFGYGLGELVRFRVIKNDPELQKRIEIDQKDERNIAISNRAKAKAYDCMLYVLGAIMIAFALIGVGMVAILLLVAAYLLVIGVQIFYLCKYSKEM